MNSKIFRINRAITNLLSLIIVMVFILNTGAIYVMGATIQEPINEFELTWKDGYAEDRVVVVLSNEASLAFNSYDVQDYLNIDCESVDSLTKHWDEQAKLAVESISVQKNGGDSTHNNVEFDLGKYNQILCIKLSSQGKDKVIDAIEKLQAMDAVIYAGPDIPYYLDKECDDPELFYGMIDFSENHNPIGLAEAWEITTGSSAIKVGIIDTGVLGSHIDLNDNINTQLSIDYSNYNAPGSALTDNNGHGTSVAGIIGAEGNNGIGTCGVCWDVDLVSLRAATMYTDEEGNPEEVVYGTGIINALSYAESNGIKIVNMSASSYDYDPSLAVAIQSYTGLFICSAGNELNNNDVVAKYPANFDLTNIIVVGASTSTDDELYVVDEENSKGSNYGKRSVDLFAPTRIKTTDIGTELYCRFGGTSASAPVVAGVAALMLSINPNLTTAQLKDIILRSVDVIPALQNYCATGGRINAYKAVWIASNLRFDYNYTYNSLDAYTHGVICDTCECSCRNDDYSCGSGCDFGCDPCEDCHIYYTELHNWRYQAEVIENIYTHRQYCYDCGYETTGYHNWVLVAGEYECTDCGMTSEFIPSIMSLSDEELQALLAELSEDELAAFITGLDPEARNRVTSVLTPSEDDFVTE